MYMIAVRRTGESFKIIAEDIKDYIGVVRTLERFSCNDIEAIDVRYYEIEIEKEELKKDYWSDAFRNFSEYLKVF